MKLLDNIQYPEDLKKIELTKLHELSNELREYIINSLSKIGGHLGANLGVIELTIALHYVFNAPKDSIIWDVGHQSYPHKILTGRKSEINEIRQKNGISGFTKRSESIYDDFGAGHSSTSISAALGMACAKHHNNDNSKTIAIIGDGAMSAGMAYEGINNAAVSNHKNLIIILNDNKMSIDKPTGSLSEHLTNIISSSPYYKIKNKTNNFIGKLPKALKETIRISKKRAKEILNDAMNGNNLFEYMGVNYLGPIDGHNIKSLIKIFQNINKIENEKPFLLHIITRKGNGYKPAELSDDKLHGVSKFDVNTGKSNVSKKNASYTEIFTKQLIEEASINKKIIAITAAMPSGTGLKKFGYHFPDRLYDVGIAEQHAVTFAAGLSCKSLLPFVAIYSTFLQRAYDQIIHDVAIQNLPVKFAIDRAGLVGNDGATHAGSFDIAYLSQLPNFVVMAPSDEQELINAIHTAAHYHKSPISFRYPRGEVTGKKLRKAEMLEIGKGRVIQRGSKILILSLGTRLEEIIKLNKLLEQYHKFQATIIDMRFAKPIDKNIIDKNINNHEILITIEEGSIGGFAAHINNYLNLKKYNKNLIIENLFLPDFFQDHADMKQQYEEAKLTAGEIYKKIKAII
jgi:1-deoxy-D-xylulose-5-phosphate synthase